ncbi:MAG: Uma2 family endonuclease, partial [Chloroflexota bacterium]
MQTVAANHTLKNTNLIQTYHLAPDGETRKMATALHGNVGSKLNYYLWNYVEDDELGYVFDSSATYDFKDGLPKREPDVSFISKEKMQMPPDDDITV